MRQIGTRLGTFVTGAAADRGDRRRAFTLTEMLVALAVMVLAMAMVTTVFSVTTKTASTSAAIADVEALARNFADQITQDLEYCDPTQSILVIHGRTQAAALTEEDRQAEQFYRLMTGDPGNVDPGMDPRFSNTVPPEYSDPRADILMFFTNRPTVSKAPAVFPANEYQLALQREVKQSPVQVVYGHAAIDRAVKNGANWDFANDLTHIEQPNTANLSELPASRWHLSRRCALLDGITYPDPSYLKPLYGFTSSLDTSEPDIERLIRGYSDDDRYAFDSVYFSMTNYLPLFGPGVVFDGINTYEPKLAQKSPYQFYELVNGYQGDLPPPHGSLQWSSAESAWIDNILYHPSSPAYTHHVATILEEPPAALADNMALHLVPGCVWFQVEILIPEDPRNGLDHPLSNQRRDTPRWVEISPNYTYVFVPDSAENRALVESEGLGSTNVSGLTSARISSFMKVVPTNEIPGINYGGADTVDNRQVRMWPYAIRVTIRVIDQRGRLEQPITRSVVHRFP